MYKMFSAYSSNGIGSWEESLVTFLSFLCVQSLFKGLELVLFTAKHLSEDTTDLL